MSDVNIDEIEALLPRDFFENIFKNILSLIGRKNWSSLHLNYGAVGDYYELNATYSDELGIKYNLEDNDFELSAYLISLKYQMMSQKIGAWYSVDIEMTNFENRSFNVHFNYHNEPNWQQVKRNSDGKYPEWLIKGYKTELERFPREPNRTPSWLLQQAN